MSRKPSALASRVTSILRGDSRLGDICSRSPEAAWIPFRGTRETFFLLVNVLIKSAVARDRDEVAHACAVAARLLVADGIVSDRPGVEVTAYTEEDGRVRRLCRLSVLADAFPRVGEFDPPGRPEGKPRQGVHWTWYNRGSERGDLP